MFVVFFQQDVLDKTRGPAIECIECCNAERGRAEAELGSLAIFAAEAKTHIQSEQARREKAVARETEVMERVERLTQQLKSEEEMNAKFDQAIDFLSKLENVVEQHRENKKTQQVNTYNIKKKELKARYKKLLRKNSDALEAATRAESELADARENIDEGASPDVNG